MTPAEPTLFEAYGAALRVHAHCLIAEGYARLDKAAFVSEQEPTITGELVRAMRAFLESGDSVPDWTAHYSIHDDPPLDVEGRRGRARPRVDIEFERVGLGTRPRLRFEAKRLCSTTGHSVAGYLGGDGLGCFLSTKYPTTHGEAGMLGYVQSGEEAAWAMQIEARLNRDRATHRVMEPLFAHRKIHCALQNTYLSHHSGSKDASVLVIHHVLLDFGR